MPPTQKLKKIRNMNKYKNENLQKHIILVTLGLREYQNRIQHVHKSAHAKYEFCSCQERRVMTILRPLGVPGAASSALQGQKSKNNW